MTIYGTLAASKTYHAERGNITWAAADDADLTIALLRGAEYVDLLFGPRFPGLKAGLRDQEREWPRTGAADEHGNAIAVDEVPIEAERAAYEAALRELDNPGSLMPDVTPGKQIKSASVDGAVAVEYTGAIGSEAMRPLVSIIGTILRPILTGSAVSPLSGSITRG